jgi:transposase, IS5 family
VLHAKALRGNPYDGHTLGPVIPNLEKLTGGDRKRPAAFKADAAANSR